MLNEAWQNGMLCDSIHIKLKTNKQNTQNYDLDVWREKVGSD